MDARTLALSAGAVASAGAAAAAAVPARIIVPDAVNSNEVIAKMYKAAGNNTKIKGYNGVPCHTFDMMNLDKKIYEAIIKLMKWEFPSPIQSVGIMPVIEGRDILCQAQAGSGKTATFMIAALQLAKPEIKGCQIIVLSPARELSDQTYKVAKELAKFTNLTIASHIGGYQSEDSRGVDYQHNVKPNINGHYETKPYEENIVIATPGRLKMLLTRKNAKPINTKFTRLVVLDEADNILSQGFLDDIGVIFSNVPKDVQVALYSATLSKDVIDLSEEFMRNPVEILVPNQENVITNSQVQFTAAVNSDDDKINVLEDIFKTVTGQVIIFCNRIFTVTAITKILAALGLSVACISSEMEQSERESVMNRFRSGDLQILVATDLIARGIDTNVKLVVNYDIPNIPIQYVHRIGRTGRFGKKGYVVNIINQDDRERMKRIILKYDLKELFDVKKYLNRANIDI